MDNSLLELLKCYTEARGVSGYEDNIIDEIKKRISSNVDEIYKDNIKNLIAIKKGKTQKPKVMLNAHLDEVGLFVIGFQSGYIKFKKIGGLDDRLLMGKRVLVGKEGIKGVIGAKAIHLQKPQERESVLEYDSLYIDIGAKSDTEVKGKVQIGEPITFDTRFEELNEDFLISKAFDDRVGCAIITELLKENYSFPLIALFSSQEEIGLRGSRVGAYKFTPDISITIEGTIAADIGEVKEHQEVTKLGNGPVITIKDGSLITDHKLRELLITTCKEEGIPYQFKRIPAGGTDASRIQITKEGVRSLVVAVPSRYIHSPVSMISKSDFLNTLILVKKFLKKLENMEA